MIRLAIIEGNDDLLNTIVSGLQQVGYNSTPLQDIAILNAWLAKHNPDMLVLGMLEKRTAPADRPMPSVSNANDLARWILNPSQLELISPSGKSIPLSLNEYCILRAAAGANGSLLSRKILIESLGEHLWAYDERRLEALISRLRKKLAANSPDNFTLRSIRGRGYLFGAKLLEVPPER